jgi:hypothetical protein
LVVGLIQQENKKSEDDHTPMSVLHPYIHHAWEYLYLATYVNNVNTITDFVAWLHQPVNDWRVLREHFTALGLKGSTSKQFSINADYSMYIKLYSNSYFPH